MKHCVALLAGAAVVFGALPASAQTPAPAEPAVNLWYGGVAVGAGAVEKVSAVAGAEVGFRTRFDLDLVIEGGYVDNAVTRRRVQSADPLVAYLSATQRQSATANVKAPTWLGSVGLRWVFERDGAVRPYVAAEVGMASVEYKSTFALAGSDITDVIGNYGITLGQDLRGREKVATYGAGVGTLFVHGAWYADAKVRYTNIRTSGQATNLTRASLGFGLRF